MKASEDQIAEWQAKYGKGNICELTYGDKTCYVFDPATDIIKMKAIIAARRKSMGDMVDSLINNCFIGGDESFKTDDQLKMGIEDQVDELMDIPEYVLEDLENGNVLIHVGEDSIEVKKASRGDVKYSEDRDKDNKPLAQQTFLLERIVVRQQDLDELRKKTKSYLGALLSVKELKDKKYVSLKKY